MSIQRSMLYIICLLSAWQLSCQQLDAYEKNEPIRHHNWHSNQLLKGTVSVTDTHSLYKSSIILRHTDAYAYNNMWIELGWQTPGDSMKYQKLNLSLGNDALGWYGTGLDDIWEVRIPLEKAPFQLQKSGIYHYSIRQIMRDDPLQAIMSVGFRLEKVRS